MTALNQAVPQPLLRKCTSTPAKPTAASKLSVITMIRASVRFDEPLCGSEAFAALAFNLLLGTVVPLALDSRGADCLGAEVVAPAVLWLSDAASPGELVTAGRSSELSTAA